MASGLTMPLTPERALGMIQFRFIKTMYAWLDVQHARTVSQLADAARKMFLAAGMPVECALAIADPLLDVGATFEKVFLTELTGNNVMALMIISRTLYHAANARQLSAVQLYRQERFEELINLTLEIGQLLEQNKKLLAAQEQ